MSIKPQTTPNPNALKFGVGVEVGGPRSYVAANAAEDPVAAELLAIDGVASVFMTADFVTVTKPPDSDWLVITPLVQAVLERHYPPAGG